MAFVKLLITANVALDLINRQSAEIERLRKAQKESGVISSFTLFGSSNSSR